MKARPIFQNIEITDISTEGKGIGRVNNVVCFIDFVVPGDVVDVEITKKKSNYREGKVIAYQKHSDKRTDPRCKHFGICGGCKWQNLNYATQLFYKQKYVADAISRIGKINTEVLPIIPSKNIFHYRNKLEYTFSNKRWLTKNELDVVLTAAGTHNPAFHSGLGFHIPKLFDKVLDIEQCYLQEEPSNAIRLEVKKFALENTLDFFDIRKQTGLLRNLVIRNTSTGEWMVVVVFFYLDKLLREKLLNHLAEKFPQITSLQYVINPKANDSIFDLEVKPFSGKNFIEEEMEGLKFRISAKSFFQTNSVQAFELYKVAREFAGLNGNEIVYDLYTGTGTIANFVARKAKKVIGIEYIHEAIEDAKINSQVNKISNTEFFAGDIKDIMKDEFVAAHGKPDVIITDPPRAGMQEEVVKKILEVAPEKIIYVSCNPATQARDLAWMGEKYSVEKIQPVDMFPHTAHVESVAKLVRK
ncbi:MAG TPA: 23S rRNA (uracil(1939)-C(5))-methyltransferase RlmD [Bacteroidia bacterium]